METSSRPIASGARLDEAELGNHGAIGLRLLLEERTARRAVHVRVVPVVALELLLPLGVPGEAAQRLVPVRDLRRRHVAGADQHTIARRKGVHALLPPRR